MGEILANDILDAVAVAACGAIYLGIFMEEFREEGPGDILTMIGFAVNAIVNLIWVGEDAYDHRPGRVIIDMGFFLFMVLMAWLWWKHLKKKKRRKLWEILGYKARALMEALLDKLRDLPPSPIPHPSV